MFFLMVNKDPLNLMPAKLCDGTEDLVWGHLDISHYKSYLRCRILRVL